LTGLVLLPLLLLFIYHAPPLWFNGLVWVVALLALHEFYVMGLPPARKAERLSGVLLGGALTVLLSLDLPWALAGGVSFAVLFFAILFLLRFQDLSTVTRDLSILLCGLLYVPFLLGHLALLRGLPQGREWVFFVLLVVMASDTAAYFTGTSFGRRKLYPAISPNKSIEGAIGGLAGCVLGALLGKVWFFSALTLVDVLVLGTVLGVLAQLGDLFESMLKRSFGVKDSGTLIPGHGGILDRLDSLLFVFAPAYYYALLRFAA